MKRRDAAPRPATTASSCGSSFADDRCVGPPNLIAAKITDWSIPKVPCREQRATGKSRPDRGGDFANIAARPAC
jgi:hypothetical protein